MAESLTSKDEIETGIGTVGVPPVYKFQYDAAPFKQSRISHSQVKLIKVPPFVAETWRNAPDYSVVAVWSRSEEGVDTLTLPLSGNTSDPSVEVKSLTSRNANSDPGLHILSTSGENSHSIDVAAVVDQSITFSSELSGSYRKLLRERHEKRDVCKARGTIEEKRPEAMFYDQKTLFQYYDPQLDKDVDESKRSTSVTTSGRPRPKAKKQATLTEDELRVRLFSMFEEAGEEGLILKQIVIASGQPQSFVKSIVDEIAEPGRRKSDKRTVLFIKDHFNPNAVLPEEQSKKPRFK